MNDLRNFWKIKIECPNFQVKMKKKKDYVLGAILKKGFLSFRQPYYLQAVFIGTIFSPNRPRSEREH